MVSSLMAFDGICAGTIIVTLFSCCWCAMKSPVTIPVKHMQHHSQYVKWEYALCVIGGSISDFDTFQNQDS
jgi:hypothetical protein